MLSKEEIEKAKEALLEIKEDFDWDLQHKSSRTDEETKLANKYSKSIETFLQHIDELEQENNKQNKIIDEMVDMMSSLDLTINMVAFGGQARFGSNEEIKQYFEKKVEEK